MQRFHARSALFLVLGLVLLALAYASSSTGGGEAKVPKVRNGGTLVVGLAEDPDALDPTLARTFVGRIVFAHMCEKLYDLNARLQIVPQLAAALPQISRTSSRTRSGSAPASGSTTARR